MIHALYIIYQGMNIYNYQLKKDIDLDPQLVSGFLTAIGNFARETFQSGLQSIAIKNQKMSFYYDAKTQLLFCAISNLNDNNYLLENLLGKIARAFIKQFHDKLDLQSMSNVGAYNEFTPNLIKLLKNITHKRNGMTILSGLILGSIAIIFSIFLFGAIYEVLNIKSRVLSEFIILLFMCVAFFGSSVISGYLAGAPKTGLINGFVFFILSILLVLILIPEILEYFVFLTPFSLIVCMAGGYFGGLLMDRRKLYPLDELSIKKLKVVEEAYSPK
ncbi:MAG: hypothetical protein ACTSU2_16510 [Promethearchaeota archaeon]